MFTTIDQYIAQFPDDVQSVLQSVRKTIKSVVPEATEAISYQMPTFKLNGKNLVHFAAWKSHLGFYPTPSGISAFSKQLSPYENAKGSVQFSFEKGVPLDLIKQITQYRVEEVKSGKR